MFTSTVTLVLACMAFAVYDVMRFRAEEKEGLLSIAEIISSNSIAPIVFDDRKAAMENLAAMRANSHIVLGTLYTREGRVFATYMRGDNLDGPDAPGKEGFFAENGYLKLFYPIVHDEGLIGTLFIQSDEKAMYSHLKLYAGIVVIVFVSSLLISFLLSSKLQAIVSDPILRLTETANQVAEAEDYSIRATKQEDNENEIGVLVNRFNEMLSHIQARDISLHKINVELDERVKERTKELEHEIEERKKVEERLKHFTVELQRSNQELTDFASIASHDMKEPLRKITAFCGRLKVKCANLLDDQAKDYMDRMQNATVRMEELIDSLLMLSRVSTKARPFAPVDLNKIVAGVLNDLEILLKNSGGSVEVQPLPTLDADAFQMRQLFQNLITNALKFRKDGETPVVTLTSRMTDDHFWEIRVEDNGIGFDPQFAERIFKPFERLHGRSKFEGSGVGLAICQKIALRHNGTITAHSVTGKGSIFIIVLPAKQD